MAATGAAATGPPAIAESTLPKNSPAIRFDTDVSIRCPTPPIIPPTTASASYEIRVEEPSGVNRTWTVAPIVPGAPAPSSFITSDSCSTRSRSSHDPA